MRGKSSRGKLHVILGPMFSGKTSELIRRVQRYNMTGYRCLVIRYKNDTRNADELVKTHDGVTLQAISVERLEQIVGLTHDYDVIGIDEGQFFCDVVEFCRSHSDNGKRIVVAALDGTYQRASFGQILDLIPLAEEVTKLSSICMNCRDEAPYTRRITTETEVEVIGGTDKYMPVCGNCYHSS